MPFEVAFWVYVLLEFGKNNGDPYYEPTIMTHDTSKESDTNECNTLVLCCRLIKVW